MRLICPDCGAQYEIAAEMIPPGGRDVQCSNCATTWFVRGEGAEPDPAPEDRPEDDDPVGEEAEATGAAAPEVRVAPRERHRPDEETLRVLREERDFHRDAPVVEATGAPPDDGDDAGDDAGDDDPAPDPDPEGDRDDPKAKARRARERLAAAAALARARDAAPAPDMSDRDGTAPEPDPAPESERRRDRFPDIETVDPVAPDPEPDATDPAAAPRRSGFTLGFALALLVLVAAVAVYLLAPTLGRSVPALAGALDGYRDWVDAARAGLAVRVEGLADSMDSLGG